jgi:hypothetical protein
MHEACTDVRQFAALRDRPWALRLHGWPGLSPSRDFNGREGAFQGGGGDRRQLRRASTSEWWQLYSDPALSRLIENAFRYNTDIRVAAATLTLTRGRVSIRFGIPSGVRRKDGDDAG